MRIQTQLIGREREFTALLVAERLRVPILLVGEVGTGKTQLFLDYASSRILEEGDPAGNGKIFLKQLSFDTRAEEVLGWISIPEFRKGKVVRIGGIAEAEYILLDEIDKANSAVRNLFLSVLRERKLFDGEKVVPCKWKLLVGTSNRKEFDEDDMAFIDRFVLKVTMTRVGLPLADRLLELNENENEVVIEELRNFEPSIRSIKEKVKNLLPDIYEKVSDRTLTWIVSVAYEFAKFYGENKGILCAFEYCVSPEVAVQLSERLITKHPLLKEAEQLVKDYKQATEDETRVMLAGKAVELVKQARMLAKDDPQTAKEVVTILRPIVEGGSSNEEN
jgi:MoxR-like ATPase